MTESAYIYGTCINEDEAGLVDATNTHMRLLMLNLITMMMLVVMMMTQMIVDDLVCHDLLGQ